MPTTLLVVWVLNGRNLAGVALVDVIERYVQVLILGAVDSLVQLTLARPVAGDLRAAPEPARPDLPATRDSAAAALEDRLAPPLHLTPGGSPAPR